jgi:hypothetical protein
MLLPLLTLRSTRLKLLTLSLPQEGVLQRFV